MERQSNREGVKGMLNPTRYGIERVAYWLQRLTGLGLLFYFIGHVIETSAIVNGKAAWDRMLELTQTTEGHIILILVIGMSAYHTVNGIRVMLGHGGVGVGKPGRPDYPYKAASLNYKQRASIWISIALAIIAMLYGAGVLFGD